MYRKLNPQCLAKPMGVYGKEKNMGRMGENGRALECREWVKEERSLEVFRGQKEK